MKNKLLFISFVFLFLLIFVASAQVTQIPTPSGGANPAGNNGDIQKKSGTALAAAPINDDGTTLTVTGRTVTLGTRVLAQTAVNLDHNLYFVVSGGTATTGELVTTQYATLANWQAALAGTSFTGKDANSLQADPLFTNFAGGDYTLQSGSPAIGAGVFISGVSTANPPNIGAR